LELRAALENDGYELLVAGDGVEGLKLSLSQHPDLILYDQFKPRMNGYNFMLLVSDVN